MVKITLLIFVGLPAAGKTTLAKKLTCSAETLSEFFFVHICYDKLMPNPFLEMCAPKQWKDDRQNILDDIESILESMGTKDKTSFPDKFRDICLMALNSTKSVVFVIDDNMYYRSMRYSYYQVAKKYSTGFCQLYFDVDLEEAMAQNDGRGVGTEHVPKQVIRNMAANLEPPCATNQWERNSLTTAPFVDFITICAKIRLMLEAAFKNPEVPTVEREIEVRDQNILHVMDVAVRKCISQRVKEAKQVLSVKELKLFVEELAEQKSRTMADIKRGVILIPHELCANLTEEGAVSFADELFSIKPPIANG